LLLMSQEYGIPREPARGGWIRLAPLLPYAAVLLGLYVLRSAWASVLVYHAGMIIALAARRRDWSTWFRGWHTGWAIALALMGALAGEAFCLLWPVLGLEGLKFEVARLGLSGPGFVFFLWYFAVAGSWLEEAYWRGLLFSESRGPVLNDVFFAGYHVLVLRLFLDWPWVVVSAIALTITAWIWRQVARRCGGMLVPGLSHLTADVGIVLAVLDHLG